MGLGDLGVVLCLAKQWLASPRRLRRCVVPRGTAPQQFHCGIRDDIELPAQITAAQGARRRLVQTTSTAEHAVKCRLQHKPAFECGLPANMS